MHSSLHELEHDGKLGESGWPGTGEFGVVPSWVSDEKTESQRFVNIEWLIFINNNNNNIYTNNIYYNIYYECAQSATILHPQILKENPVAKRFIIRVLLKSRRWISYPGLGAQVTLAHW